MSTYKSSALGKVTVIYDTDTFKTVLISKYDNLSETRQIQYSAKEWNNSIIYMNIVLI